MKLRIERRLQVCYRTAQIPVLQAGGQGDVTLQVFTSLLYLPRNDTNVAEEAERTGAAIGQEYGLLFQPFGRVVFEVRETEQDAAHLLAFLNGTYLQSARHDCLCRVRLYHIGRLTKGTTARMCRELFLKIDQRNAELRKAFLIRGEDQ